MSRDDNLQTASNSASLGTRILSLSQEVRNRGDEDLAVVLSEMAERYGATGPSDLLSRALHKLSQGDFGDFWSLLDRAGKLAPEDPQIRAASESIASVTRTYILDSKPHQMDIRDAGEFLEQYPSRGKSFEIFSFREPGAVRPLKINLLRDVYVVGSEGTIIDPSTSSIFRNSFSSMRHDQVTIRTLEVGVKADLTAAVHVPGATAHLCGRWSGNFFHWVSELLPRAFLLHRAGFDGWYMVPNCMHQFIIDSLRMIGIRQDRIIRNDLLKAIRCDSLVTFDSYCFTHHYENPHVMLDLRACLLDQVDTSSPLPDGAKGIYILRRGYRAVQNGDEVAPLLTHAGILPIRAEELSFEKQVSIAARSRFVFGPHGAGLTLSLFMPPESTMVEFQPIDALNVCYDYIAHILRHRHFSVPSNQPALAENGHVEPCLTLLRQIVRRELGVQDF